MKKSFLLFFIFLLFLIPFPLGAVELVGLEINEEIIVGKELIPLTVTGTFSNGVKQQLHSDLVWGTSDSSVANVTSAGTLYFTGKEGPVTIFVYRGAVSGKKTITAKAWPESLHIETALVYSAQPYRLLVRGKFSDGTIRYYGPEDKVTWFSTNPWVAWVNNEGVVTFTGEKGYVAIKAVAGAYSDSVNTTVDADKETTAWRKGIKIKEEIKYSSKPQQLTLVALLSDETEEAIEATSVDWFSSETEIAYVNREGKITFTGKPGFTTIKASFGGYHYERLVQAGRFMEKIALNQSLNYTPVWDNLPLPLSVTALYNDGSKIIQSTNLTWKTSNEKVAAITEEGVLTFTGEPGTVQISAAGKGEEDKLIEDVVTVNVPPIEKPNPRRLYIDYNPLCEAGFFSPRVFCIFDNGERREVTEQVEWSALSPETASIYQGIIYFSPNPGKISLRAGFRGLTDTLSGYLPGVSGSNAQRVSQLRLKEHYVPFSFIPLQLTGLALRGGGRVENVTSQLRWHSSQPLVARVDKGVLTFTGRIGKTIVTAQGFGFRDSLTVEVYPEDLQPRAEQVVIEGELSKGANQLKATAYFNNGTSKDVTSEAVWNTSNKNKVTVTKQGHAMFLEGWAPVTITAHYGGKGAVITRP